MWRESKREINTLQNTNQLCIEVIIQPHLHRLGFVQQRNRSIGLSNGVCGNSTPPLRPPPDRCGLFPWLLRPFHSKLNSLDLDIRVGKASEPKAAKRDTRYAENIEL